MINCLLLHNPTSIRRPYSTSGIPNKDASNLSCNVTKYNRHERETTPHLTDALSSLILTLETETECDASLCSALEQGRHLHHLAIRHDLIREIPVLNKLLSVYVKCGCVSEASCLFARMSRRNVVSWTTMVAGFTQHGHAERAIASFDRMKEESCQPNLVTYISLLKAFTSPTVLERGKCTHSQIIFDGLDDDAMLGTALIKMYTECSFLEGACRTFDNITDKDVVAWTAMMTAYIKLGHGKEGLELFHQMHHESVLPNHFTYNAMLNACASLFALNEGKIVHARVERTQIVSIVFVGNALLDMYAKCGSIDAAYQSFKQMSKRDVVSWNALIAGFAQHGNNEEALRLFEEMKQEHFQPNEFTYSCVLSVCTNLKNLTLGKDIHRQIKRAGFDSEPAVVHALIDMYAKCGSIQEAHKLFDKLGSQDEVSYTAMITGCVRHQLGREALELFSHMPKRDVHSWTAMIQGYVQQGCHRQALEMYEELQGEGLAPNEFTFGTVISACAGLLDVQQGREVHGFIVKAGYQSDVVVENALLDMYARCGSIFDAWQIFEKMSKRDAVSWNIMIGSYAQHGKGKEALQIFRAMQSEGIMPDEFTFSSVLSACKHTGLVNEGCYYFNCMIDDYGIAPSPQHYTCIIDLLGRAGCLNEADDLIRRIPSQPNAAVWTSLLSACRIRTDVNLAEQVSDHILRLKPGNPAAQVLLSNIFAATGRWEDHAEIRSLMKTNNL